MAGRGPMPTPTPILKARGSWRANQRIDAGEPQPKIVAPPCPRELTPAAKALYKKMAAKLVGLRVLAETDGMVLAQYCQAVTQWAAVQKELERFGMITDNWLKAQRISAKLYELSIRLGQELGLSPASRARVRSLPDEEKKDERERFFNAS